jgi:hypothetical protein
VSTTTAKGIREGNDRRPPATVRLDCGLQKPSFERDAGFHWNFEHRGFAPPIMRNLFVFAVDQSFTRFVFAWFNRVALVGSQLRKVLIDRGARPFRLHSTGTICYLPFHRV